MENPKLRCLRLWLENEFPFEIKNDKMEFKLQKRDSNVVINVNIFEKGIYQNKNYILANFFDYIKIDYILAKQEYDKKLFNIILGEFEVEVTFSIDMIKNGYELYKFLDGGWPAFHDSTIKIINYNSDNTILRFYDALPDNYVLDLIINEIIFEDYREKTIDFLENGKIVSIEFSKKEEYFEIKIVHYSYFDNKDCVIDYEDEVIIRCKCIEFSFYK
ncbi:hypothetical protein [Caloramator sp. ALD01]|uniref:hypothetical protein n=1 Tax=Caloramator sp. ALD01 TaxID=1031288 RepID=UPI0003FD89A9|nr:hypothetical protein [Caloramator sp. ALD01]